MDKKNQLTRADNKIQNTAPAVNKYFLLISDRFRIAKLAVIALLAIFILGMLAANRDELTVENFRYLIRYLDTDSNVYGDSGSSRKISYSTDAEISFSIYRGDFSVSNSSELNIFAASGSNVLSQSYYILNPVQIPSDRNLLIYDLGGTSFAVYNTFSKLYGETLEYPITGGTNSDSGIFAIVTKTNEYRGAVLIYDKNFNLVSRILKDKLIMSVALNDKASRLLTVSAFASNGDIHTEVMLSDPYSDNAIQTLKFDSVMPLTSGFNENNGFYVICDSKALFFDSNGLFIDEYDYGGKIPDFTVSNGNFTALSFPKNVVGDTHKIVILDHNASVISEKKVVGQIVKMVISGNDLFVLTEEKIIRLPIYSKAQASYAIEKNSIDLLALDKGTLFICFPNYAVTLDIEKYLDDLRLPDGNPPEDNPS